MNRQTKQNLACFVDLVELLYSYCSTKVLRWLHFRLTQLCMLSQKITENFLKLVINLTENSCYALPVRGGDSNNKTEHLGQF